ncbi:hypothetical protein C8Q80DRAFT_1116080 [Daedaleopsis nitida]|nr:hypothetical protein C8Q80DRAFT_1116080 [Daedaleopsis nitida]
MEAALLPQVYRAALRRTSHLTNPLLSQTVCTYDGQCYAQPYEYPSEEWQLCYPYTDPEYSTGSHDPTFTSDSSYQHSSLPTHLPLHAPVPISTYTSLLADETTQSPSTMSYFESPDRDSPTEDTKPPVVSPENPLDVFLSAPQVLIPTPAEFLHAREPDSPSDGDPPEKPSPKRRGTPSSTKRKRESREKTDSLNQRKAYFRSVSKNVGFTITDPDSITSHDKKRSYLECLEEYVLWLHEQIRFVGRQPLPIERISTYRGLKNRSLRTILVHEQNCLHKLNMQKLQAEDKFMELQNALLMREAAEESLQFRRHSIAMGAIPHGVVPSFGS